MSWNLREYENRIVLWATILLIIVAYPNQAFSSPQPIQSRLEDGVVLKVHLPKDLEKEGSYYARQVLQAASAGYEEIVFKQGFGRSGYTFADPRRLFAYDKDRAIDIYIADVEAPFAVMQPVGGLEYKAKIFIPADYKTYRKRYKIDQPQLELKAALTHELLHIITYSYNRNMQAASHGKASLTSERWDWYTEGLARYFETLVGYRQEFLSRGFRKRVGKKIMVYKGGANYFLRYPDQPLNKRKYGFALFWEYVHQNYGMDKIEEISFKFREIDPQVCSNRAVMEIIAQTLGVSLKDLWRDLSLHLYKTSYFSSERRDGLRPVSMAKLSRKNRTYTSISSFGFDFYEVDLKENPEFIQLSALNNREGLNCLIGISSAEDFRLLPPQENNSGKIEVDTTQLPQNSKMIIMLSNPTDQKIYYRISLN